MSDPCAHGRRKETLRALPDEIPIRAYLLAVLILVAELTESSFAVDGSNYATLHLVVAAVQNVSDLVGLCKVAAHGIFDQLIRCAGSRIVRADAIRFWI